MLRADSRCGTNSHEFTAAREPRTQPLKALTATECNFSGAHFSQNATCSGQPICILLKASGSFIAFFAASS